MFDPKVLQSGFGVSFQILSGEFRKIAGIFLSEFLQRHFSANVLALFLQGFMPPKKCVPKTHAQNPSVFLSSFTLLNQKFFHADFLGAGETKIPHSFNYN